MKRKDHGRPIWFTVSDALGPVDLTNATSVVLVLRTQGGTPTIMEIGATKGPNQTTTGKGRAYIAPTATQSANAGVYDAEVEVTWSDSSKETYPSVGYKTFEIVADLNNT